MATTASDQDDMPDPRSEVASSGIEGLDFILEGGFPRNRIYLVQGDPGVGKTTLSLQFLLEGARRGERGLYITLSETKEELDAVARSHGWSLDGLAIQQVSQADHTITDDNTLFHPSEVELGEATRHLLDEIRRIDPSRVVFDSLSEIRLLAQGSLRFRRQILGLKQFFAGRHCTVLLLEDQTKDAGDLQSLVHGVVHLELLAPLYGAERRRLRVIKLRGVKFRGGFHDYKIDTGGLQVFPRLVASDHHTEFSKEQMSSGSGEFDDMVGGGLERGTSTLFMGPAGTGKSVMAMQIALSMASQGERGAYFTFDEGLGTLRARSESIGQPLKENVAAGNFQVHQVDPAELPPGEFAHRVQECVERDRIRVVVIDSLNGYLTAMPEERFLAAHLHELFSYLRQCGVLTVSTIAQHGFLGGTMVAPVDISYLADTVILFRYFELEGEVRKALSVMKKRSGLHQSAIRQYTMSAAGVEIGPPLRGFRGIMTGVPVYSGEHRSPASGR